MGYLFRQDPGLREKFDLSQPSGVFGFTDWFIRNGESYVEDLRLVEPVAERAGRRSAKQRAPPALRSAEEADISVIGYLCFALGSRRGGAADAAFAKLRWYS